MELTRRLFLKLVSFLALFSDPLSYIFKKQNAHALDNATAMNVSPNKPEFNLGVDQDGLSGIYIAKNGTPEKNMKKVIEMIGGIESIIGQDDIVILKPNAQWWNQGMTNTNAMKAFIELILDIQGFKGEVIIAENHHFPEDNSRGWTTNERNGSFNYNELIEYFIKRGFTNVTKCHWHDGGPSRQPSWGGAEDGGVLTSPREGNGYVWCHDDVYVAPTGRKAIMNYPVFTSSYSGIRIDFKNGAWQNGKYLNIPVKFINFSALNHHGQTGVTASIKNYLGISDMTCGYRGKKPSGYYNFHYVGFSGLPSKIKYIMKYFGWEDSGPYIGGAVGKFMKTVRMADLNIITAEWVGWGGRTTLAQRSHMKTVLASRDPVALDYYAAKYVLLPATISGGGERELIRAHNPENEKSVFKKFITECHKQGIGTMNEHKMKINVSEHNDV